jgi:hypothetical protein
MGAELHRKKSAYPAWLKSASTAGKVTVNSHLNGLSEFYVK